MNIKKVLLIGKNGQLGSAMMQDRTASGFEIISFERNELDATNEKQVKQKMEETHCDILINASAYHVVTECEKNPDQAMIVNCFAVAMMARLCKERNIPFVTYSTFYVFDGEKGIAYAEEDAPHPLQMYSISKFAGEYATVAAYPEGAIIIRTGALYGGGKKGSPKKGGNFVLDMLKHADTRQQIEVSSEQIANPTFAGDLSSATFQLLDTSAPGGIYHLVNEGYCSYYEFAQDIIARAGKNVTVIPVDRNGMGGGLRRPRFGALKNIKASAMGVVLRPWKDGLTSYMASLNEGSS